MYTVYLHVHGVCVCVCVCHTPLAGWHSAAAAATAEWCFDHTPLTQVESLIILLEHTGAYNVHIHVCVYIYMGYGTCTSAVSYNVHVHVLCM